ncbi:putative ring finger protein p4h10.07 [Acrodontium crateriforme]|uniref:Ring finger protein p4h10.07 n=1 Tax=Acrodontium crateriforme TaxID=150365 RepID=A0AAQ3M1Q9_9PEZI|nr:putative ring finger protein p4h10.07 [Acrodontium crateriforme]
MGQSSSRPERNDERDGGRVRSSRVILRRTWRRSTSGSAVEETERRDEQQPAPAEPRRNRLPRTDRNRLSQMMQPLPFPFANLPGSNERVSRGQTPQRARSALRDILHRDSSTARDHNNSPAQAQPSVTEPGLHSEQIPRSRAGMNRDASDYFPPRLPSIDVNSSFESEALYGSPEYYSMPGSATSSRRSNLTFNALRPDRPFRQLASSFRRRRSPQRSLSSRRGGHNEDQATMLSRLLSVAAAATAATLMGDDHQALSEARSLTGAGVGEPGSGGEDGSFDGFLRALQNGRIASALRQSTEGGDASREGPLNFFRMFRFGASGGENPVQSTGLGDPSEAADAAETRMVPIIIVGIRSISPNAGSGSSSPSDELPSFLDALGHFSGAFPANDAGLQGHDSIDSILRPVQNGTSFRHRRRASMGGFGINRNLNRITDRLDDQRASERRRDRPWSVASSSSTQEPRPPPATPASPSPELSRISSRASTPSHSRPASFIANSLRDFPNDTSRRNSTLRTSAAAGSSLGAHAEETTSLNSGQSSDNLLLQSPEADSFHLRSHRRSDTTPSVHYPRFASGHPRRNGVVEPDNLPSLARRRDSSATDSSNNYSNPDGQTTDTRSWIIYVLGGSYPENHPILTTPSLFTENPTYEDMMLLSALLGPAKAPVASDEDVQSAGGIYTVQIAGERNLDDNTSDQSKIANLVAVATESDNRVEIDAGQRCLVCLCDFAVEETCRKLVKCNHLFHQECIDQWLTRGRNSCPLCRGQGVDEKETNSQATTLTEEVNVPDELSSAANAAETAVTG